MPSSSQPSPILLLTLLLSLLLPHLTFSSCSPHWCSQHGLCSSPGPTGYCFCEYGYTSPSCSRRVCPRGDDPETTGQNFRTVALKISASKGVFDKGHYTISFNGEDVSVPVSSQVTTPLIMTSKLKSLKNIADVLVTRSVVDAHNGATYTIKITKWPTIPYENNVYTHDGNPLLSSFSCNITSVDDDNIFSPLCEFTDVSSKNIVEYSECSNHGGCSPTSGRCTCDPGWKGISCDDNKDAGNVEHLHSDGPFFTGTVLKLEAASSNNLAYNHISAVSGGKEVFLVAGSGAVNMKEGSLNVEAGDISLTDGTLQITSSETTTPNLSVIGQGQLLNLQSKSIVTGDRDALTLIGTTLLSIQSQAPPGPEFNFLSFDANKEEVVRISGDGHLTLNSGITSSGDSKFTGIVTSGGGNFGEGGVQVMENGKLALGVGSDLEVEGGKVSLTNGDLGSAGLHLSRGGLSLSLPSEDKAKAKAKGQIATLVIYHNIKEDTPFIQLLDKDRPVFTVGSTGSTEINSKLAVKSGGLTVESGGLTVNSGGANINGALTLNGALNFNSTGGFESVGGIRAVSNDAGKSALYASASSASFSGSVLELVAKKAGGVGEEQFLFLEAKVEGGASANECVFKVNSEGSVESTQVVSRGDVVVNGNLDVKGTAAFSRVTLKAGARIEVEAEGKSFIEISDNEDQIIKNELVFIKDEPLVGQILAIKNSDQQSLHIKRTQGQGSLKPEGSLVIPRDTLLILIYSPPIGWTDVTVASAHSREFTDITTLTAANNLDIGKHSLAAQNFIIKAFAGSTIPENQLAFFTAGGVLSGSKDVRIKSNGVLKVSKMSVDEFVGTADFKGSVLMNAALVNATVEGVKHLSVESLGVLGESDKAGFGRYSRVALFNDAGMLRGENSIKFDEVNNVFRVNSIGGLSSELKVSGSVNFMSNVLKNVEFEKGAIFKGVNFQQSIIENSVLKNVTAEGLELGDVDVDSLKLTSMKDMSNTFVSLGDEGKLNSFEGIKIEGQNLAIASMLTFTPTTDESVSIQNANLVGGTIKDVKAVSVTADLDVAGDSNIGGELFVGGSLTVSGSVLGSGPYIDASDARFKKNVIELELEREDVLEKLEMINGVYYEVDEESDASKMRGMKRRNSSTREIGFIAQDIEKLFPELVETREDGLKGVLYARFTPVLIEAVKELRKENRELTKMMERMEERMAVLERRGGGESVKRKV